ncbi:hypothetical protein ACN265_00420 [Micromonospora sp. WMMD730]|uniref:hypothetical protein n=1 Tax=Micromonospora sp. WMMD730 TaxID=3404128 RepID=UPI003B92FCAE
MDWQTLMPPFVAAGAALLGVRYGAQANESRESFNWTREQRLKAYADVLEAVDRCYSSFRLIDTSLKLMDYKVTPETLSKVKAEMDEWGRWDEKIDEALPRAELVASQRFQVQLSVGVRHGMRSRHRMLLIQLAYLKKADEVEWQSVAGLTLDDLERIRTGLRADLAVRETEQSRLSQLKARALAWRRKFQRKRRASRAPAVGSTLGQGG